MKANCTKLTERILQLTLEIIYLLTGEDNIVVEKTFGDNQNSMIIPLRTLLIPEKNNELKILEVTKKIVKLLTVEVENVSDLNIVIKEEISEGDEEDSMIKEKGSLDGQKNPNKDVMMASQPALTSMDGSSNGTSPERCSHSLFSQDSTQDLTIPHHHHVGLTIPHHQQEVEGINIKTEMKAEEEINKRENQPLMKEAEMMVTITKEESYLDVRTDYNKDDKGEPRSPGVSTVTHNLHHKPNHMAGLAGLCNSERSTDESHTTIPNVQPSFNVAEKPPHPSNPEASSPDNLYPFQDCEKSLIQTQKLIVPQKIQILKKPFLCIECMKYFGKKSHLIEHQRIHTGERPYVCSECKKNFGNKSDLVRHYKVHTGEKPYSCPECGKSFAEKSKLKLHQRVHTGEKPFSCPECGRCFSDKGNCDRHVRIHTG